MKTIPHILLYGAGGHGKVVADCIERAGTFTIAGFVDDEKTGELYGYPIVGGSESIASAHAKGIRYAFASIGNPTARQSVEQLLRTAGFEIPTVIHPSAQCARESSLGEGTVLMPGTVIGPSVIIGPGCIVNTNASVDHDCMLGSYVHIAPGAHLAGDIRVGDRSHIGIGSVIREGITIGKDVFVGAGSVVVQDLPHGCTAYGVPAKPTSPNT